MLAPKNICGYVCGVAYHFKLAARNKEFLLDLSMFMARAGMKRLFVQRKTSAKHTLFFTVGMILRYKTWTTVLRASVKELGHYTAMCLAFINLLRRSEYIPTKANLFMHGKDVLFVLVSGEIVPSWKVTSNQSNFVSDLSSTSHRQKLTKKGKDSNLFIPRGLLDKSAYVT